MASGKPRIDFDPTQPRKMAIRDDESVDVRNQQNVAGTSNGSQKAIELDRIQRLPKKSVTYKFGHVSNAVEDTDTSGDDDEEFCVGKSLSFHPSLALIRTFSKHEPASAIRERVMDVVQIDDHTNDNFIAAPQKLKQTDKSRGSEKKCRCALKKNKL